MPDWKNIPLLFPRARLHPVVVAFADELLKREPELPWCVAFSGGADSLALVLTLLQHWPAQKARVMALHFNHQLRGAESDEDAGFCREVCSELGLEIRLGHWKDAYEGANEIAARAARKAFFSAEMAASGSQVLWTGHQKDDVAESLLMRLARGSSTAGLAAPRPLQPHRTGLRVLRPLLSLNKAEIYGALRSAGITWREDASNEGRSFFRNRIRNEVIPAWKNAAENDAVAGAALTREWMEEDDAALEAWLEELIPADAYDKALFDASALANKPRALLRRALRRWRPLSEAGRLGFSEVLAVFERKTGQVSVGQGWVTLEKNVFRYTVQAEAPMLENVWQKTEGPGGTCWSLHGASVLKASTISFAATVRDEILKGNVDPSREAFVDASLEKLEVRGWRSGDKYRPLGAPGVAKLQDLFVNRKIAQALRAELPVVCGHDNEIIWVPGFPPADNSKITDTTVTGVHLTYESGTYTVRP